MRPAFERASLYTWHVTSLADDALFFAPSNLEIPPWMKTKYVDGDLYNVCLRVKEISDTLTVIPLEGDGPYHFAIAEDCPDGVTRLVFRCKELDARAVDHLREIMFLDFQARVAAFDKEQEKAEADRKEQELDELYERVGAPMLPELERAGFIQRPVSYPKTGVTGGKGSKAKS